MSELLSTAASVLGLPEALVQRSAEARAADTGATVDEVLTGWAGGAPAPAADSPAEPADLADVPAAEATAPEDEKGGSAVEASAPAAAPEPSVAEPPQVTLVPYKPPVLVGASDNPLKVLLGVVVLFVVVLLVGLIGPSIPLDAPGVRTSEIAFSAAADQGRSLYLSLGCASCHTQMVRPVIADVGLGAVTLDDTNQVPGTRRFGPDLSNVGGRLQPGQVAAVIGGAGGHPSHGLGAEHLEALVAYLAESTTMRDGG